MNFIYFHFISHFIFILFLILNLGLKASIILYVAIKSLLSLLPPSYIVVPSSKLVNIMYISSPYLQIPQHHITDSTIDINMEDTRGYSLSSS